MPPYSHGTGAISETPNGGRFEAQLFEVFVGRIGRDRDRIRADRRGYRACYYHRCERFGQQPERRVYLGQYVAEVIRLAAILRKDII